MKKHKEKLQKRPLEDFITVVEAAKLRGVSRAAIHALIQRGRLRSENMLGRVLLYKDEVLSFEKTKPGPKATDK